MKGDDIVLLEKEIDFLSKEFKIFEENYNRKDLKKFSDSKKIMLKIQSKISGILK